MQLKGTADARVLNPLPKAPETFPGSDPRALSGTELAEALIEHSARLGASGYSNELLIDGETWVVGIAKRNLQGRKT